MRRCLTAALPILALSAAALSSAIVHVSSTSMGATLCPGDYVLARGMGLLRPFAHVPPTPSRGQIVVVSAKARGAASERRLYVKRVVALAPDRVRIDRGQLFVNGSVTAEPYAIHSGARGRDDSWPKLIDGPGRDVSIPAKHAFVLGDNRDESYDSRQFGFVRYEDLVGTVIARMPFSRRRCAIPGDDEHLRPNASDVHAR